MTNVIAITDDTMRSAAREAAFKYADNLQRIAAALQTDKALSARRLRAMFRAAEHELRHYADSLDDLHHYDDPLQDSQHSRVLAVCLRRYADRLHAKAKQPATAADLLTEAQSEIEVNL